MSRIAASRFLIPALFLAACSVQEQNGQTKVQAAPIFTRPSWSITQHDTLTNGEKVCTISAGEVDVTLHSYSDKTVQQVAVNRDGDESSYYTITVNGHSYETKGDLFAPGDADAIINDFLTSQVAYTELSELGGPTYTKMRRYPNKIHLEDFGPLYKKCQEFEAAKK